MINNNIININSKIKFYVCTNLKGISKLFFILNQKGRRKKEKTRQKNATPHSSQSNGLSTVGLIASRL